MTMTKTKVKVGRVIGNADAPVNKIVRHMREWEMQLINNQLDIITSTIAVIVHLAEGEHLGDSAEGVMHILDSCVTGMDDLKNNLNSYAGRE
jgi:hypothetical protein